MHKEMASIGSVNPNRSATAPISAGVASVETPTAKEDSAAAEALRSGNDSQLMSTMAPISPPWKNPPSGNFGFRQCRA